MTDIQPSAQPPSNDATTIAVLVWIGTIFFSFIPALILYLVKKDDAFVQDQSKEALNWAITVIIAYAVSGILVFIVIGILLAWIVALVNLVFCILGAINASKGVPYRLPFNLRLIK
ncbi:DUF4870 domain-containing protein [Chitiniphilus shinanonensis]|uniref:DUF4870 domain-containing protein n=1 Tax=Chitiniphilus shinanonensis TaxID=553088 RepID=UPI0030389491